MLFIPPHPLLNLLTVKVLIKWILFFAYLPLSIMNPLLPPSPRLSVTPGDTCFGRCDLSSGPYSGCPEIRKKVTEALACASCSEYCLVCPSHHGTQTPHLGL